MYIFNKRLKLRQQMVEISKGRKGKAQHSFRGQPA
jgi:hypothetical protein